MRQILCLALFVAAISPPVIDSSVIRLGLIAQDVATEASPANDSPLDDPVPAGSIPVEGLEQQLEGEFSATDIAATTAWVHSAGVVDWLGPLAPLALSPFFGVTCLSGLAIWGPEWATDNALLGASGPLQNRALFFVFLALTILTSVPRLTKVSKPFAQSVDRLEAYAVIVILLVIKIIASMESPGDGQVAMVQLGIFSFTLDTLLAIAMVINILVINSVKFFFEFMVWLTPVPFLDAVFEVCNKTLCVVLMAIYALSPTLATIINLLMLLVAAIVLRWIDRRVRFYRTMILDPVIARLWSGFGKPKRPELIVFPKTDFGPFAAKSRLRLCRATTEGDGWHLKEANWWMPANEQTLASDLQLEIRHGWVMHAVEINKDGMQAILSFSRRYDAETLEQLAQQLGMRMSDETAKETQEEIAYEFS